MECVVNKIIEIDRMANEKISDAQKNSSMLLKETEEKCRTLKNDICFAADKRIKEIENINKSDFDSKIAVLEKKYAAEKDDMNSFFEAKHTEIENMIFTEIVGE